MSTTLLTKADIAKRYGYSKKSVDKACSDNPYSLPKFFKMGSGKSSPIRFRLEDVLAFEEEMLAKQAVINEENDRRRAAEPNLAELLGL